MIFYFFSFVGCALIGVFIIGIILNLRSNIINSTPQEAEPIPIPMVQPCDVVTISPSPSIIRYIDLPIATSLYTEEEESNIQNDPNHPYIIVPIESVLAEIL